MEVLKSFDDLGRIVIPAEMRNTLNLDKRAEVRISLDGRTIRIEPCENLCVFCGKAATVEVTKSKSICHSCASKIKNKA